MVHRGRQQRTAKIVGKLFAQEIIDLESLKWYIKNSIKQRAGGERAETVYINPRLTGLLLEVLIMSAKKEESQMVDHR
jgi:hypothetical protein